MARNAKRATANAERVVRVQNGWLILLVEIALFLAGVGLMVFSIEGFAVNKQKPL